MWIDQAGVARTAAPVAPTDVMAEDFRTDLDALAVLDPYALLVVIAEADERIQEFGWSGLSTSEEYVGAPPPAGLLCGRLHGPDDVAAAIERTELRWRLDVIKALDDYLA